MLERERQSAAPRRLLLLVLLLMAAGTLLALEFPSRTEATAGAAERAALAGYHRLRNAVLGPPLVGLQIGHLEAGSHPRELASLRASTGGSAGGLVEVEVNGAVANALAARLEARGITVDLLPATVPPRYSADLVLAIHGDSSADPDRRGYKSAVFRQQRNRWDGRLKSAIDRAYLSSSGLPDDDLNVSGDMLEYYAFNRRYRHSLARRTPAAIVELGYLSHPEDRRLLSRPERVAALLEEGIIKFLAMRGRLPDR
jgi:hypothetical protein